MAENRYVKEKLTFLRQLLQCDHSIYSWTYSGTGDLLDTDCDSMSLRDIFVQSGCLEYALGCEDRVPVCLSTLLGMIWGAAFEAEGNDRHVHIIGPVLNTELPLKTIEDAARHLVSEATQREEFVRLVTRLPIAPLPLFQHYMLMLHFCLTGEHLTASDIQYQHGQPPQQRNQEQDSPSLRDRYQTYMAEKHLLYHVREGDLNYKEARIRAASLSNGIRVKTDDPIEQVLVSTTSFTTLCTRAAIEGGLIPDTAYTVGDAYIQAMLGCKTVSELGALSNAMYEDFVRRVHKARVNQALSKPIRTCCEYIQMHPEDELPISSLAALCSYTDYYLSRKFKKETGISINTYIDFVRIERAKLLLETTDRSIANIASALHYCSSTHFSDTFRRVVGKLPHQYRKETQAG